jgi:hypothetical protein
VLEVPAYKDIHAPHGRHRDVARIHAVGFADRAVSDIGARKRKGLIVQLNDLGVGKARQFHQRPHFGARAQ